MAVLIPVAVGTLVSGLIGGYFLGDLFKGDEEKTVEENKGIINNEIKLEEDKPEPILNVTIGIFLILFLILMCLCVNFIFKINTCKNNSKIHKNNSIPELKTVA